MSKRTPPPYQGPTHYALCIHMGKLVVARRFAASMSDHPAMHRLGHSEARKALQLIRSLLREAKETNDEPALSLFREFRASGYQDEPLIP